MPDPRRSTHALAVLALALAVGAPELGCTVVVRGESSEEPPPAARVEMRPVAPGPGYVWVDGHWERRGRVWVWVDGRWERGKAGYRWVAGHWELRRGRYYWVPGRWVRSRR